MTNSFNKMAGKNSAERNGTPGRSRSTFKLRPMKVVHSATYINSIATPPRSKPIAINFNSLDGKMSPGPPGIGILGSPFSKGSASPSSTSPSSRTSPGLLAGHFAGGKWSEPPSPASLPKPPQHWTQLIFNNNCSKFANSKLQQTDIASQSKVLLNVRA